MIKYDEWEEKGEAIKKGDTDLMSKAETAISATSLESLKLFVLEAAAVMSLIQQMVGKVYYLGLFRKMDLL